MSKSFAPITFDAAICRAQLADFAALLRSKPELSERADILPFFRRREQLAALIGSCVRDLGRATEFAFEFPFSGDFAADLILGDRAGRRFCAVEFEDGRFNSVFRPRRGKSTTEWGRRLEHGFSQIVDWFSLIDDTKKTDRFRRDFGGGHVRFSALLVIGRDAGVSETDRRRLDWRSEKVRVDSHSVECMTYDELFVQLDRNLAMAPPG